MQISTLPVTPLQRQSPRQDSGRELHNRELLNSREEEGGAEASRPLFEPEANNERLTQRSVESSSQTTEVFSQGLSEGDDLSLNSRRALQTFTENTPSAQQQLGVDLAGIDTYA